MTMAVPMPQRDVVPPCFGKEWNPREPECAGGPDPNFTDAHGGHIRQQCEVFSRCAARTQILKNSSNLVPTSSLVRPLITPPPPPAPVRTFDEWARQQNVNWVEEQRLRALSAPRPAQGPTVPHSPQQQLGGHYAAHYPATRYELNYAAPDVLTVPEERVEGEHWVWPFLREGGRAAIKFLFMAWAASLDKNRLRK